MNFHKEIEHILVYRKKYGAIPNLPSKEKSFEKFKYYIKEKGQGKEIVLGNKKAEIFSKDDYEIIEDKPSKNGLKEIWASGTILDGNSSGRFFRDYLTGRIEKDGLGVLYKVYGIGNDQYEYRYFTGPKREGATKGKYYQGVPVELLNSDSETKVVPIENFYNLAGNFGNCRLEGGADFRSGRKPEALLKIILDYFSDKDDIVMDSFAGSGTTGASAHKMGRQWLMIEMGEHAKTHIKPRMESVISGNDKGGITEACNWESGGGFRYCRLEKPLFDETGKISESVKFADLAAHVFFTETGMPIPKRTNGASPFLGSAKGTGYYLLFNGILGDKTPDGGNVLTGKVLAYLPRHSGPKVIFGEGCRLGEARLRREQIIFKQLPYEIKVS
jgi:adenine-specific DNA-methyltransferase